MKTYTNGQRKGMMYGGAAKRKPMMYGGMATTKKKTRKKAQAGGMMTSTQGQQNQMQNTMMQGPKMMADGGMTMVKNKAGKMVPDFAADGKGKMMYGGMAKKKMR